MQAIDSSGPNLVIMMNEMDPELVSRNSLNDVIKDLHLDQKRFATLKNKRGGLNNIEQKEFEQLKFRSGGYWNMYYWTDRRFQKAWIEFNDSSPEEKRNYSYDFWIRAGIRWLFEKRKSVSDWKTAVKAYNGSGARAQNYMENVVKRRDESKKSFKSKKPFYPKVQY